MPEAPEEARESLQLITGHAIPQEAFRVDLRPWRLVPDGSAGQPTIQRRGQPSSSAIFLVF